MSHERSWMRFNYLVPRTPFIKMNYESQEKQLYLSLVWLTVEYISSSSLSLFFKREINSFFFFFYVNMACDGNVHSLLSSSSSSTTLGWKELYSFNGVFNADMSTVMETIQPFFSPSGDPDMSTGYLQDALIEWNNASKRRRLSFDGSSSSENIMFENFNCFSEMTNTRRIPDEGLYSPLEEAISGSETTNSSSSCCMDLFKITQTTRQLPSPSVSDHCWGRRKKLVKGVVYPFAVVKPGGFEGDMTLNDINKRIHMPPTRSVKHPVGDFACRPCISPDGPGISGKAVVSFTKIQTQGRGTITIVRTRG